MTSRVTSGLSLKVLTLNCWGIFDPFPGIHRLERMAAIGKELSKGEYDLIMLQEVWTQSDYESLSGKIMTVLPYTHYFHSGIVGAGLCFFSKHPIGETVFHQFSINGYAHKVWHGDWYGGKGIGLAKINVSDIHINVYGAHLHAQYHEPDERDEYLPHRIIQAHEMSQFIKHTSETCDMVIVAGDFNMESKHLGYKMLRVNANLMDAWLDQKEKPEGDIGATCDTPDNPFASKDWLTRHPQGCRLDYIMFRNNAGYDMTCQKCRITLEAIPDSKLHYSDHKGVAATFILRKNITAMSPPRDTSAIEKHFTESLPLMDRGIKKAKADMFFYAAAVILCVLALVFMADLDMPYGFNWMVVMLRLLLILGLGYSVWMGVIMTNKEVNCLNAAKKDINNLLKSNPI